MVWAGAANRDEEAFLSADRFEVTRRPNKHLAFGHGIHHCLGAGLARVEGQVALETIFDKLGRVEPLAGTSPEFVPSIFLFGLSKFELAYEGVSVSKLV